VVLPHCGTRLAGEVGERAVEAHPIDHVRDDLALVEGVLAAARTTRVKPRAVDLVLEQPLTSVVGDEPPDVGADVTGAGERRPDGTALEGDHVVTCLGSPP